MNCDDPKYRAAKLFFGEYICVTTNVSPVDKCCSDPLGTTGPYCINPITSTCQPFISQNA